MPKLPLLEVAKCETPELALRKGRITRTEDPEQHAVHVRSRKTNCPPDAPSFLGASTHPLSTSNSTNSQVRGHTEGKGTKSLAWPEHTKRAWMTLAIAQ
jgi:hypothetical protein